MANVKSLHIKSDSAVRNFIRSQATGFAAPYTCKDRLAGLLKTSTLFGPGLA